MPNLFKIHPAIGIARVGNSPTEFCLTPETAQGLPLKCDSQGRATVDAAGDEQPIETFKDAQGRIKRQAARFRVYIYQDANDTQGRELKLGDKVFFYPKTGRYTGAEIKAEVKDIQWTVYLANKKASWYAFQELAGEHGYAPDHPLRNADITDPDQRQRLIIDPGPQTVSYTNKAQRRAEFALGKNPEFPQCFPPPLQPNNITTLGELIVHKQNNHNRLVVLGGYGNAGSFKTGFGQPYTQHFANNDGWFDDVADGPVTAKLVVQPLTADDDPMPDGTGIMLLPVDDPAWVLTASPSYAPQLENMITLADVAYDIALRAMAYDTEIYGPQTIGTPPGARQALAANSPVGWNDHYYPYFYRDIWPILRRPTFFQWVLIFDPNFGGDPHNTDPNARGNLDFNVISVPPYAGEDPTQRAERARQREFIYKILRKPGQENQYVADFKTQHGYQPLLMPLLFGDNPLTNTLPSKFLRLTDTQLFFLRQWRDGKFINEKLEGLPPAPPSGHDLDVGVLWNTVGGAFCPGGEVCWIIRNPAIYAKPYRIKHAPYTPGTLSMPNVVSGDNTVASDLSKGLEPGDLTKYSSQPWQTDFNECASQDIEVTYNSWDTTYPASTGDPFTQLFAKTIFWWPAHRPMEVFPPNSPQVPWSRDIPSTNVGDLQMVTAWSTLGFIQQNPDATPDNGDPLFIETERNDGGDKSA